MEEYQEEHATASWDHNSSLADVVKSILGPNQEGPVIVHVNNYEGVAVVEVAEPQKYGTGEEIDPSSLLVQKQDMIGMCECVAVIYLPTLHFGSVSFI